MMFDEILKEARRQLKLSQEQFAHELSVSFTTLNRWENNRSVPSRLAKLRIVEYCSKKGVSKSLVEELKRI
jgi:DNA-binding transcriptional regulator YiaG